MPLSAFSGWQWCCLVVGIDLWRATLKLGTLESLQSLRVMIKAIEQSAWQFA